MNRASALVRGRHGPHDDAEAAHPEVGPFAAIYEQHLPEVYRYLLARTGREEDAVDLAQQTFTQALAALPRYRNEDVPIRAWIFRIARNLLVDHYRRRRPTVPLDSVPDTAEPVADDDPEASAIRGESLRRLHQELARLDAGKRDLLAMRFASGLKVREIATIVNRSESAVRSELRRILLDLQEHYPND